MVYEPDKAAVEVVASHLDDKWECEDDVKEVARGVLTALHAAGWLYTKVGS